ncbi:MAG TPA: NADH-quinone oxidoreductase subunit A [Actinomycetota bacterium]|nr:NADH-quinone oxidoreductase subunit A [Actinomycetota bacterium]
MTLSAYLPVLILGVVTLLFGLGSVMASSLLSPKYPTPAKLAPYECGITPTGIEGGDRFPIKFYVFAMLFIIFDIETVFMYPWAVVFKRIGIAGIVEMGFFALFLLGAYVYVWKSGGLEWE